MTKYTNGVHYWNIEWENVPAADLAETIGDAVMQFCVDDEGWLNYENVGDMIHHLVTRRNVLKECDSCSRLVAMDKQYCGDDECMEDD